MTTGNVRTRPVIFDDGYTTQIRRAGINLTFPGEHLS